MRSLRLACHLDSRDNGRRLQRKDQPVIILGTHGLPACEQYAASWCHVIGHSPTMLSRHIMEVPSSVEPFSTRSACRAKKRHMHCPSKATDLDTTQYAKILQIHMQARVIGWSARNENSSAYTRPPARPRAIPFVLRRTRRRLRSLPQAMEAGRD